jgi:hypothetical protein
LTLETDRGVSMMLRSSPMTSPIGRTVGSTCSETGTSLTVYFSSVVTSVDPAVGAGVPVLVITGGGFEVVVVVVVEGGLAIWACRLGATVAMSSADARIGTNL